MIKCSVKNLQCVYRQTEVAAAVNAVRAAVIASECNRAYSSSCVSQNDLSLAHFNQTSLFGGVGSFVGADWCLYLFLLSLSPCVFVLFLLAMYSSMLSVQRLRGRACLRLAWLRGFKLGSHTAAL